MDTCCSLNQKNGRAKHNGNIPEGVNAGFLVIALSMIYTPQLTACWGLTALKVGWDVVGLTPGLQATSYLLRCCFPVRPATAREVQQAQELHSWVTPR